MQKITKEAVIISAYVYCVNTYIDCNIRPLDDEIILSKNNIQILLSLPIQSNERQTKYLFY